MVSPVRSLINVDFPAPLAPIIAVRDERVRAQVTSCKEGFEAPGYVYVQLDIRMMARVEDLTPVNKPGDGNLNWTCDAESV